MWSLSANRAAVIEEFRQKAEDFFARGVGQSSWTFSRGDSRAECRPWRQRHGRQTQATLDRTQPGLEGSFHVELQIDKAALAAAGVYRREEVAAEPAAGQAEPQHAHDGEDHRFKTSLGVGQLKANVKGNGADADAEALLRAIPSGSAGEACAEQHRQPGD